MASHNAMHGADFIRHNHFNKGTAFAHAERSQLGIVSMLPPYVETLEQQVARCMAQLRDPAKTQLQRYSMLRTIAATNTVLFYAVLNADIAFTLPIIYTPTVGEACWNYSQIYEHSNGLFVSLADKGRIQQVLQAYKAQSSETHVDVIVVSDGSRILGLGDLGANGMGIPFGKCALYVAGAGVNPRRTLPVLLDVGTNTERLLNDPMYIGLRQKRPADEEFYAIMDEFCQAVQTVFPEAVLQFEDFSNDHCFDMLERYRHKQLCFNDDIQGTGCVVSAGFANAVRLAKLPVMQHTIVCFGAGSAAVGVVDAITSLLAIKHKVSKQDLMDRVYLVDTKGLVTNTRGDKLQAHKVPWARKDIAAADNSKYTTLLDVVKNIKPTALIGLAGVGPAFTQEMVELMCLVTPRPIIFALSNPTSKCEIDAADGFRWSDGKAIIATGSPFPPTVLDGPSGPRTYRISQGNNMYVFPGLGLGCVMARAKEMSEEVLVKCAATLSEMVSDEDLVRTEGLYPPLQEIRKVSAHIAAAAVLQFQHEKVVSPAIAGSLPTNMEALVKYASDAMWQCQYEGAEYYVRHLRQ